tara:strand:- start:123 stop:422 length:300 start_codon:yes stop_codon:yes gene_type:complete
MEHYDDHENKEPSYEEEFSNFSPEISNPLSPSEDFSNINGFGINVDLVLKSIFFGAIFYLLSCPEVYKLTSGIIGKKVDGVLVHSLVYAVLYYIIVHFI